MLADQFQAAVEQKRSGIVAPLDLAATGAGVERTEQRQHRVRVGERGEGFATATSSLVSDLFLTFQRLRLGSDDLVKLAVPGCRGEPCCQVVAGRLQVEDIPGVIRAGKERQCRIPWPIGRRHTPPQVGEDPCRVRIVVGGI